jgi:MFS family permease
MSQPLPEEFEATANLVDGGPGGQAGDDRRQLLADRSFWGMLVTQFLGAFNDNLYKQLMLLLAISAGVGVATTDDLQGWATFVFSLPFVLFSGFAGYLSDRFSKTPIIVLCKVGEIVIMLLGLLAFYFYGLLGWPGTWVVLFLMGLQSTFFGPGKYGILPELFRPRDLPRANGLMLMTTFLAIIFGTVFAGSLKKGLIGDGDDASGMWPALAVCVGIAVVGTCTSMFVRRTPAAQPSSRLTLDSWGVSRDMWQLLTKDRPLLLAVMASSIFWLISGMAVPTVNRVGKDMLLLDDEATSALTASIAFGIMVGAVLASFLCRKGWGDRSVTWGLFGIFACVVGLGMWRETDAPQRPVADDPAAMAAGELPDLGAKSVTLADGATFFTTTRSSSQEPAEPAEIPPQAQKLRAPAVGLIGSIVGLLALGVCAAVFAIPVQVFLQDRPPAALKGRMIATMNQANFVGILLSGPLYQLFEWLTNSWGWPISSVFWMMGCIVLPVAVLYRLDSTRPRVAA